MTDDHKSNVERLADEFDAHARTWPHQSLWAAAADKVRAAIEQDKAAGWLSPDEARELRADMEMWRNNSNEEHRLLRDAEAEVARLREELKASRQLLREAYSERNGGK